MKRFRKIIFLILALGLTLLPLATASAATPGSAGDPLVTKSWVDTFVAAKFDALQKQVDALAARVGVDIKLYIGKSVATVNGAAREIDADRPGVTPVLKLDSNGGGYTMVPIRFIAESLGVKVEWLADTRQVKFTDGKKNVVLDVDSTKAKINGKNTEMAYASYIENQRTFVHVRFVAEAFNCKVGWDQNEKRVDITR